MQRATSSAHAFELQSAIKLNGDNMKAYWRGAKAALGLGMPDIAIKIATKVHQPPQPVSPCRC
jgi:hypothetical protein